MSGYGVIPTRSTTVSTVQTWLSKGQAIPRKGNSSADVPLEAKGNNKKGQDHSLNNKPLADQTNTNMPSHNKREIRKVTSAREFRNTIAAAGDKKVVVDFYATWCGPCRNAAPIYKDLAAKYGDVVAISVDVDELGDVAETCGVSAMPTFQVYRGGSKIDELIGAPRKEQLEQLFQR